jgi:hypothetical protein
MKAKKTEKPALPKPAGKIASDLDKLRAELDTSIKRSQQLAERQEALRAPQLPPEVILRARQLEKKGKFTKKIVKRTPVDMRWDSAELECGHRVSVFASSGETGSPCGECTEAWLLRQARKAKR